MVPGTSIPAAVVILTLHNWRMYVHLLRYWPYNQISERSATARISHRRTKDARTYTLHTPGLDEPRTQTVRISHRHAPSSYAFKTFIAPASVSFARYNTRHTSAANERPTLSGPAHTWYKSKADAFTPATYPHRTLIGPNQTIFKPD